MTTLCELQIMAKQKKLHGYSRLRKNELEEYIRTGRKRKQTKKKKIWLDYKMTYKICIKD